MNIAANKSPAVVIGEPKCMLVAVPAQATFIETPALRTANPIGGKSSSELVAVCACPSPASRIGNECRIGFGLSKAQE